MRWSRHGRRRRKDWKNGEKMRCDAKKASQAMADHTTIAGAPLLFCACILGSLVLSLAVGCSAFAPSSPPCVYASTVPQEQAQIKRTLKVFSRNTPDTAHGFSFVPLYGSPTPTVGTKELNLAQKFLADREASGRVLTIRELKWWRRFGELEEYKGEHGHCNVLRGYNPQLGSWVNRQRMEYNRKNLSSERIEALERIGFEWIGPKGKRYDASWSKRLNELEEYKRGHGHCIVPQQYTENPQLGSWVNNQRMAYNRKNLSSERIEALERVGFEWIGPKGGRKPDDDSWSKRLNELDKYKREHGHCNVPQQYKENPQLGSWVNTQRRFYIQNKLSSERVEALERIAFEWIRSTGRPDDASWWKRFGELEEYKRGHGHCNVPRGYKENPQLGSWVNRQRVAYNRTNLSSERIEALERIGFEWIRKKGGGGHKRNYASWWKRFGELEEYKQGHGHCNVPRGYKENPQLGSWVNNQRTAYNRTNLSSERIEALERVGFEWTKPNT